MGQSSAWESYQTFQRKYVKSTNRNSRDADAAIKKAIKEFEIKIDPKRLLVVRRA
jgi:hypothetical protein